MKSRGLGLRHVRFCAELKLRSAASLCKELAASSSSGRRRGPFLRILGCSAKPAASASDGDTNDKANRAAHTHTHTHTEAHAHTLPASRDVVVTARRPIGGGAGRGLRGPASWRRVTGGGAVVRAPSREAAEVGVCGAVRPGLHVRRAHFGCGGCSFFGNRASWTWQASTSMPPGRVLVPRGSRVSDPSHLTFLERSILREAPRWVLYICLFFYSSLLPCSIGMAK